MTRRAEVVPKALVGVIMARPAKKRGVATKRHGYHAYTRNRPLLAPARCHIDLSYKYGDIDGRPRFA